MHPSKNLRAGLEEVSEGNVLRGDNYPEKTCIFERVEQEVENRVLHGTFHGIVMSPEAKRKLCWIRTSKLICLTNGGLRNCHAASGLSLSVNFQSLPFYFGQLALACVSIRPSKRFSLM